MSNDRREDTDLSRRSLASVLGALGGAIGVSSLAGCAPGQAQLGQVTQALTGTSSSFEWVDTIGSLASPGELRSLVGSPTRQCVQARGFWACGDGGDGVFYWDAAATYVNNDATAAVSDDGGTFIRPTSIAASSPGRWRRLHQPGVVSVLWFGAKRDGVTDDTGAFHQAIAAVGSLEGSLTVFGGTVHVPAGRYLIGDVTIKRPVHIVGTGCGGDVRSTTMIVKDGGPAGRTKYCGFIVIGTGTPPPGYSGAFFGNGASISNLAIIQKSNWETWVRPNFTSQPQSLPWIDGGCGIWVASGGQTLIHGVAIYPMFYYGIAIGSNSNAATGATPAYTHCYGVTVERTIVVGCGYDGVFIVESSDNSLHRLLGTWSNNNGRYGFYDGSTMGTLYEQCQAEANEQGGYVQYGQQAQAGHGSTYIHCYFEGNGVPAQLKRSSLVVGGILSNYLHASAAYSTIGGVPNASSLEFGEAAPLGAAVLGHLPYGDSNAVLRFAYDHRKLEPQTGAYTQYNTKWWNLRRVAANNNEVQIQNNVSVVNPSTWVEVPDANDRTWLLTLDDTTVKSFGWTDDRHPRGAGHFFFAAPLMNNPSHWTVRRTITVAPGRTVRSFSMPTRWLAPSGGAMLAVHISVDASSQNLSTLSGDVRVGPHAVRHPGTEPGVPNNLEVVLYNDSASAQEITLLISGEHISRFFTTQVHES
jgi:hypothetical protein